MTGIRESTTESRRLGNGTLPTFFLQYVVVVSLLQIFASTQSVPDLCSIVLLYRCCYFSLLLQTRMLSLFLADVFANVSFLLFGRFSKPDRSLKFPYLRPTLYQIVTPGEQQGNACPDLQYRISYPEEAKHCFPAA